MHLPIFCPNFHLILDAQRCPQCGWTRPTQVALGEAAWPPLELGAEIGGPGRHVFARPASAQGMAILPLQSGTLVGIDLADGRAAWRKSPNPGLHTRTLVASGNRLLASLSDERQFTEAEHGMLVSIAPDTGNLTTLWDADTPLLSQPVPGAGLLCLRTSKPELVALRTGNKTEIQWHAKLNSSGAMLPPCISGKHIFVSDGESLQGKSYLNVYELETGNLLEELPTDGMLYQRMLAFDNVLIFQNGHKQLVGLDADSLGILWKKEFKWIYTSLSMGVESVLVVVRGDVEKGAAGYYSLLAIHPRTGESIWSAPLPSRVIISPMQADEKVYLGSEDGQLFCLDASAGDLLWKQNMSSDEDPLRTELLFAEGLLLAGTYSGKFVAVRVSAQPEDAEPPEVYEQGGDFESAAAVYAMRGNFRKAARIYAEKLQDYPKALALYEHDKLYREAGNLARSHNMLAEAEGYFMLAGDVASQADVALERGDKLGAARLYEQDDQMKKAANLYEEAGENGKAKNIYQVQGDILSFLRLQQDTSTSLEDVDFLEKNGRFLEAAEAICKVKELPRDAALRRAADLFQRAEKPGRELEVLQEFARGDQEAEWAWSRITPLAKSLGRFAEEAEAWEQLGKFDKAAEAYQRAGRQAEQVTPEAGEKIANFYEKAAHYYSEADCLEEEKKCRDKIAQYRCQPIVVIDVHAHKEFKELEMNTLDLEVRNEGYGIATEIHWEVDSERFEIDLKSSEWALNRLSVGGKRSVKISIRPKRGEIGTEVPFLLEWFWKCKDGDAFQDKLSVYISVKARDDTRPTGPPPIIFQGGGTVIQAGKYVYGDDVSGDKGDKVEINRGSGVKVTAGQDSLEIQTGKKRAESTCPICKMPVEADAEVCIYCGNKLSAIALDKSKKDNG